MAYPHKWSPISYKSSAGQQKHTGQRPMLYRWTTPPKCARILRCITIFYKISHHIYHFPSQHIISYGLQKNVKDKMLFTRGYWGTLCHSCISLGWIEHDRHQLTLIAREVAVLGSPEDIVCRSRRNLLRMACQTDQLLMRVTVYIHISLKILKNTLTSTPSMQNSLHIIKMLYCIIGQQIQY